MKFFLGFMLWLAAWCALVEAIVPGVPGMG